MQEREGATLRTRGGSGMDIRFSLSLSLSLFLFLFFDTRRNIDRNWNGTLRVDGCSLFLSLSLVLAMRGTCHETPSFPYRRRDANET